MKNLTGIVTSAKMSQTAVVTVTSQWQHPIYNKTIKRSKKYLAHDPIGVKEGDQVSITPTRPISKRKTWRINQVVSASATPSPADTSITQSK